MKARVAVLLGITLALLVGVQAQQPQTFGEGVSLTEATPLARLLDRPADFEGKTVRVEGRVAAVCAHMGCWMAFAPDGAPGGRTLLVKVDDGEIVFPLSAKGRRATVQGVIQRIGTNDAEAQEAAAEHARHTGSGGAEARTSWQLKSDRSARVLAEAARSARRVQAHPAGCRTEASNRPFHHAHRA